MSKIKEAIEYYDVFLDKHGRDEAITMLTSKGFVVIGYDPECNLLMAEGFEDPTKIFSDMRWHEEDGQYRLTW